MGAGITCHIIAVPEQIYVRWRIVKKTCNEGNKKVVILSKKKMYLCSDECWGKWLQNLNKPYLNKETRKNSALSNTNVNNKRND